MEDNELKDDLIPTNEAAPHNDNTHNDTIIKITGMYQNWFLVYASYVI